MLTYTHSFLVNDPNEPEKPQLDHDRLWQWLRHKAESPVSYIPCITEARVVERYPDGFLREIVLRDMHRVRERVTLEPQRKVVFHQLDNPDLTQITNEIGYDEHGRLTYTLTATLSPEAIEKSQRDSGFIMANELLFYDTARATVNTLRLLAYRINEPV